MSLYMIGSMPAFSASSLVATLPLPFASARAGSEDAMARPPPVCDRYHRKHVEAYDWFELGFDHFGRTSTEQHTE